MDVLKRIDELRLSRGWTLYRLADEAAVTQSTLTNMFTRKTLPSLTTLKSICDAFGISLSQFFDDADIDKDFTTEERILIDKYRMLNKRDKDITEAMINIFLKDNR